MQLQEHPDGIWFTSYHEHKGRKILIKARKGNGMKCHVFYPNSMHVEFTIHSRFIKPERLLEKARNKIDAAHRPD